MTYPCCIVDFVSIFCMLWLKYLCGNVILGSQGPPGATGQRGFSGPPGQSGQPGSRGSPGVTGPRGKYIQFFLKYLTLS